MNAKYSVIVDCQLLQTDDRNRGMGLLLINLLKALKNKKPEKMCFTFIINSNLEDLIAEDKQLLNELGEIKQAELLSPQNNSLYASATSKNKKTIDQMDLFNKSDNSVFFIPALFSSGIYPVFPSSGSLNLLFFHDIIPYLYPEHYLNGTGNSSIIDYAKRWGEAYKTDLFVTNSQTTADDLNVYFGIDPNRTIPILGSGAHSENNSPTKPKIDGLTDNFVLMPSGDDYRKNNQMAARAFNDLNTKTKLVITSTFSEHSKRQLKSICSNIIFSGNVSSAEMNWLTDHAKFVFFPSLYEGLGMPILEAITRGATIACSDIPVFKEISDGAFHYFDPNSQNSITQTLSRLLSQKEGEGMNNKEYEDILKKFSWDETADRFVKSIDQIQPARVKKKLAVFCPSPSSYSAVGKYVFEGHAELSRYFNVDYYYENGQTEINPTRPNILEYAANYRPVSDFNPTLNDYDYVLYNIGNSEFHAETILRSLSYPANALIHDTWLNGIFDYMERYRYLSSERRKLESIIDDRLPSKKSKCLASIISNQKAIFGHSKYAEEAIKEISSRTKYTRLPLAVGVPKQKQSNQEITVSFAGIISESKGMNLLNKISEIDDIKVKVFGYSVLGVGPLIDSMSENVEVLRDLSDKQFQDELAKTDILISYRVNYRGETSKSVLEAMRFGVVVVVNNTGWFAEIPDNCVAKVDNEVDLIKIVNELVKDPIKLNKIGNNARDYIKEEYSFSKYARLLADNLERNK